MSEDKRFTRLHIDSKGIVSLKDNGILKVGELNELEDLLNQLNDENERLREELRLALN